MVYQYAIFCDVLLRKATHQKYRWGKSEELLTPLEAVFADSPFCHSHRSTWNNEKNLIKRVEKATKQPK